MTLLALLLTQVRTPRADSCGGMAAPQHTHALLTACSTCGEPMFPVTLSSCATKCDAMPANGIRWDRAGAPAASEFVRKPDEDAWAYAQRVFDLVFHRDIERVARIEALWESRPPPTALPPAAELLDGAAAPADAPAHGLLASLGLNPRQVRSIECADFAAAAGCQRACAGARVRSVRLLLPLAS